MTHNLIKSTNAHTNEIRINIAAIIKNKNATNAPTPASKITVIIPPVSRAQTGNPIHPINVNISKVNP